MEPLPCLGAHLGEGQRGTPSGDRENESEMAAASGGSGFNLVQDGFVDGIYHFLWQKISQQSCPNVSIPDTVVFKYRQPAYWYFMSVDGSIKMKTQKNITNAKIFEAFSKQRPDAVSDIVAYYISPVESERGVTGKTTIEFFDVAGPVMLATCAAVILYFHLTLSKLRFQRPSVVYRTSVSRNDGMMKAGKSDGAHRKRGSTVSMGSIEACKGYISHDA